MANVFVDRLPRNPLSAPSTLVSAGFAGPDVAGTVASDFLLLSAPPRVQVCCAYVYVSAEIAKNAGKPSKISILNGAVEVGSIDNEEGKITAGLHEIPIVAGAVDAGDSLHCEVESAGGGDDLQGVYFQFQVNLKAK